MAVRAQRGRSARQSTHSLESNPDRLRHPSPAAILLALQPSQVGGGHRERRMVQESGHVLDALTCISAQLGSGVPEDVDASRRKSRLPEVPLELCVEGTARDAPQGPGGAHHLQVQVPSPQNGSERVYGGLQGVRRLPVACLPVSSCPGAADLGLGKAGCRFSAASESQFSNDSGKLARGHRAAEEKPLRVPAVHVLEELRLLLGLHPFGDG